MLPALDPFCCKGCAKPSVYELQFVGRLTSNFLCKSTCDEIYKQRTITADVGNDIDIVRSA